MPLYVYASILEITEPGKIIHKLVHGWRRCASEDEARGGAVKYLREEFQKYSIAEISVAEIPDEGCGQPSTVSDKEG